MVESAGRAERLASLTAVLVSPAVQAEVPSEVEATPARLKPKQVAAVWEAHVPNVRKMVYRSESGNYILKYLESTYFTGLTYYQRSELHNHLLWLMRLVVHYGHEGKPGAASYLRQVAEAFTDCQAVQARTIERVGLQIRGVALDFRGHLVRLAGEYKLMALKMLSFQEARRQGHGESGKDPIHFDNRLIADIGDMAGIDKVLIRQARLDGHAASRFPRLSQAQRQKAVERLQELFEVEAFLKAFIAEVGAFSEDSEADSLPCLFLTWAEKRLADNKHCILDESTCKKIEVGDPLALAVVEAVFLGRTRAPPNEVYRGEQIQRLIRVENIVGGSNAEGRLAPLNFEADEARKRGVLEHASTSSQHDDDDDDDECSDGEDTETDEDEDDEDEEMDLDEEVEDEQEVEFAPL